MSAAIRTALLVLAATGWAAADLPKKVPITRYTNLWQNSPFTSKPPPPESAPEANPLEDYALAGVSPISGGYRVTLINKKTPEERIFVYSDDPKPKHGFKILAVTRKSGDPLGTVVRLSSGSVTGTVSYDDKLLALAQPKPQAPHQPQAQPGQPQPQPLQPGQMPQRQPRPRVVPPPVPGQVQPQAQPQIQVPQPQVQPNAQRPDRRGGRDR
jgi:hypothetical protein